jgi:hypothetical protein
MIHFTCDVCKRELDPDTDLRYVVRMEVYAALDRSDVVIDDDRDHLEEIDDMLEAGDDLDAGQTDGEAYQLMRFDLCSECRKRFLRDPLGRRLAQQLDFSQN